MRIIPKRLVLSFAMIGAIWLAGGCGNAGGGPALKTPGGSSNTLMGAGSSFVFPAMSNWAYAYQNLHPDLRINYQSVGSGAGIAQFQAGTIDFAASDVPVGPTDLAKMPSETLQFPATAGCEAMIYNLPGFSSGLKFSGDVIADIYLGKITTWDDPRITAENPGATLPSMPIAVVHRSDGSGTTYAFTDYLCAVSPAWKSGPSKGKTVNWPVGVGAKGSEGVAGLVKQTPGGFAYDELSYALQTKLTFGDVRNASGAYVTPTAAAATAAANGAVKRLRADITASIVNVPAKDAYPISTFSYVIFAKSPKDRVKAKFMVDFLSWIIHDGQSLSASLQYATLPDSVVKLDESLLAQVQVQ